MKYTVMGFSQKGLLELELDMADVLILRWFIDFKDTGDMVVKMIDGKPYYWVKYDKALEDLPILPFKKRTIEQRFIRLAKMKVLTHKTVKEGGTYSFYGIGEKYAELLGGSSLNYEGSSLDYEGVVVKTTTGSSQNCVQNINLLKDKSIKDNNNYKDVIDYLNEKAGKSFKCVEANNKLIRARYNEGYTLEDFYRVIDYKVLQWKGNEWEKYLRPSTLFSAKNFENYLNDSPPRNIDLSKETENDEGFKNFLDMFKGAFDDE